MTENIITNPTVETPFEAVASAPKKIRIVGGAAVLTSALKLEDLKTVAKYQPEALKLKGGKDNEETVFMAGIADKGYGGFCGAMGVMFAPNTTDANGHATVTVNIPEGTAKPAEWFVENFGGAIMKLRELEASLPTVITKLAADKASVLGDIEIG